VRYYNNLQVWQRVEPGMVRWNGIAGNDPLHEDADGRRARTGHAFPELSTVRLTRDVDVKGRILPKGARGTVVAAYSDGIGYEVEFETPFHAVVTLEAGNLSA
jgi:hypothetical protein